MTEQKEIPAQPTMRSTTGGTDKETFTALSRRYGLSQAVARGLASQMSAGPDSIIKETDFVSQLKKFTGTRPA